MILCAGLIFLIATNVKSQQIEIGQYDYKFENSKWYRYSGEKKQCQIIPNRMIIRLTNRERPNENHFNNLKISGVNVISGRLLCDYFIIQIDSTVNAFNVAKKLYESNDIESFEFDAVVKFHASPNDTYYSSNQPNLQADMLDMPKAWDIETGNSSIIVAVIDDGIDIDHSDLDGNVWTNLVESTGDKNSDGYPGVQDVDDDGDGLVDEDSNEKEPGDAGYTNDLVNDDDENGFIDDFHGWNFEDDDNDVDSPPCGHGTSVAGIIAAETHNSSLVAGIAGGWTASNKGISLMAVKIADEDELTPSYTSRALSGVTYASENGANVINMSFGVSSSTALTNAITKANDDYDCVLVASVGNDSDEELEPVTYPASHSKTIGVGAVYTDEEDRDFRYCGSNGGTGLDVVAPSFVYTLTPGGYHTTNFGETSAACPHVTGLAALILSVNEDLTPSEVKIIICNTAEEVNKNEYDICLPSEQYTYTNGWDGYMGNGRINAYEALKYTIENYGGTIGGSGVTVTFHEDITIAAGATLTIEEGTDVEFENYTKLIVNGTLKVDGTSSDKVTFTADSKGDWYGVVFNSGASSSSYMKHCIVENAYIGIKIDGSDPTIEYCEVKNADLKGIYVTGVTAQPTIKYCNVHNADWEALYVYNNADPDVFESKFHSSGGAAVNIYAAKGLFCGNEFKTNSANSVVVNGSTSNSRFNEDYYQGNLFDMNNIGGSRAVYVGGGTPDFGDYPAHEGTNDFLSAGTGEYYIYNNTGNTILAEGNYWGASTPDVSKFYGTVDSSDYYSSSQDAGPTWKRSPSLYLDALLAYNDDNYKEALNLFEELMQDEPEHERIAKITFLYAESAMRTGILEEKLKILGIFIDNYENPNVDHVHRVWKSFYYASIGQMDSCKAICLTAPQGSNAERELLLSLIGYYVSNNDRTGAEEIATLLQSKRTNDLSLGQDIEIMLNSPKLTFDNEILPKPSIQDESETTPNNLSAYPNPFNPTTTIQFYLCKNEKISVKIYDVLGRRVKTLIDSEKNEGLHSVQWDGRNSVGVDVAAGIYFARLESGTQTRITKLLLVR